MKIRSDFVTNSSSSSFILAFKTADDVKREKSRILNLYGPYIAERLFQDIQSNKTTKAEMLKELKEGIYRQKRIAIEYSDANYLLSPSELQAKYGEPIKDIVKRETELQFNRIVKSLPKRCFMYTIVEYEDHSEIDSKLQYDVCPYMSSLLYSISHH